MVKRKAGELVEGDEEAVDSKASHPFAGSSLPACGVLLYGCRNAVAPMLGRVVTRTPSARVVIAPKSNLALLGAAAAEACAPWLWHTLPSTESGPANSHTPARTKASRGVGE